jgi:hypothetical protein
MNRSPLSVQALAVALLLAVPAIALADGPPEAPRKLSEAERQAAVLAAGYLDQGPAAWWDRLSRHSPLRRLGREAALAEIEVRAGPPAGAEWELEAAPEEISRQGAAFALGFPSGVDDTLVLGLVQEEGSWKIESLRIAAEPVAAPASNPGDAGEAAAPAPSSPSPPSLPSRLPPMLAKVPSWLLLAVAGAGALLLIAAGFERERRGVAIPLGLAGGLIAAAAAAALLLPRLLAPGAGGTSGEGAPRMAELRALLPLRRALTQADGAVPSAAPPETRQGGVAGQVAQLWWAQNLVGGMDLRGADGVLKAFPSPGLFPLAELLRARTAFLRLEDVPTATAYQRAASVGIAHEGLLYESAQAFLLLGFHEHAKEFLHQLAQLGARQAGPWLALAQMAVLDDHSSEARADFRTGWQLEPSPRADILDRPLLTVLLGDLEIRRLIHLGGAAEPVVACPEASRRAIVAPTGFRARLLGGMLRLHDARILATKIADPERLDPKTLDAWVAGLRNYVEVDALAEVAARAPNARGTMDRWMASDAEWITAAGWKVMAHLARTEGALSDADCDRFLATVERDIHGAPNRVRHEMNSALIAIGGYHPALTEKALAAAARIGKVEVDHGDTDCKTPDAAGYIRKVLERKKR